jgi:hypothetical protein
MLSAASSLGSFLQDTPVAVQLVKPISKTTLLVPLKAVVLESTPILQTLGRKYATKEVTSQLLGARRMEWSPTTCPRNSFSIKHSS